MNHQLRRSDFDRQFTGSLLDLAQLALILGTSANLALALVDLDDVAFEVGDERDPAVENLLKIPEYLD